MKRPPDFLGIGAQRAGTTWLDALLRSHPALYLPGRRKELHYFDEHYDRGPEWYARFFEEAPADALVGEITPRYLFDEKAAERIASDLPDARLIAVLREPVSRAYSQYALTVRDEAYAGTFERFLAEHPDALARGLYHYQLSRYSERFPRERVCVLVFEDVRRRPAQALAELGRFLGVDPAGFDTQRAAGARNAGRRARFARSYAAARRVGEWLREHDLDAPVNTAKRLGLARLFGSGDPLPGLAPKERVRLREHFARDSARLAADFGLDLEAWKAP